MDIETTKFYNKGSSFYLGWNPTWFGLDADDFGERLEEKVKNFQDELDIKVDGLVGPVTYRRLVTAREAHEEDNPSDRVIKCDLSLVNIDWDKVDTERYYNKLPSQNYKKLNLNEQRNINKIVVHWDAALSSESCFKILQNRGYSTHFSIDNDGTIYQFLNTNHVGYHVKETNANSIGIDISNAYYTKYNRIYERRGFGKRPVITSEVNGQTIGPHLGYYDVQIGAATELIKSLVQRYNIPLTTPNHNDTLEEPEDNSHSGIFSHYHFNSNKIDTAGLSLKLIIKNVKADLKDNE